MEIIITLIVALLGTGILTVLVNRIADRKKTSAEADQTIGESWNTLVNQMRARMDDQDHEIEELKQQLAESVNRIKVLEDQLAELTTALRNQRGMIQTLIDGCKRLIKQIYSLDHEPVWDIPPHIEDAVS